MMATNKSDAELDRDWKPSGRRPQSTIARSFSAELMDIFRIENSVADLDEQVDKRKHQVQTQSTELEALEARIREMEERLRRSTVSGGSHGMHHIRTPLNTTAAAPIAAPAPPPATTTPRRDVPPPPPAKKPVSDEEDDDDDDDDEDDEEEEDSSEEEEERRPPPPEKNRPSRPGTARQHPQHAPSSAKMPPTPVASEGEYEFVDHSDEDARRTARPVPPPKDRRR